MSILDRLPSEVLVSFFIVACRPWTLDWKAFGHLRAILRLVCRRWWITVDSCEALWTMIPLTIISSPKYIDFVLKRAGSSDLTIYLHLLSISTPNVIRAIDPQTLDVFCRNFKVILMPTLGRVRNLTVRCARAQQWHFVRDKLDIAGNATTRSFSLYVVPPWHQDHRPLATADRNTTIEDSAVLRELRLFGTTVVWKEPQKLPQLTALRLLRYTSVSWVALSTALRNADCLQLLEIRDVQFTEIEGDFPRKEVLLPNVHTLVISVDGSIMASVVGQITVPALTTLDIRIRAAYIESFLRTNGRDVARAKYISLTLRWISREVAEPLLRCVRDAVTLDVGPLNPWGECPLFDILKDGLALPQLKELQFGRVAEASDIATIYGTGLSPRFAPRCIILLSYESSTQYNLERWSCTGSGVKSELISRQLLSDSPGVRWVTWDLYQ
ncbi:hypothetical protein B0H13DRAFT_2339821 [Mycena leptocephala]|nr:hypothetical protein B0H13DRAFT_2339821 [Mycena leptocephala]